MTQELTVSGKVNWKFKWLKLKKFESYLQVDYLFSLTPCIRLDHSQDWDDLLEYEIFEIEKRFFFTVWLIPVLVELEFEAETGLDIDLDASIELSYNVTAEGLLRAGVRWKKGQGWSPIRKSDVSVQSNFTRDEELDITVTPSLTLRLEALFYELSGPFVELVPFAEFFWNPLASNECDQNGDYAITARFGADINAGITFSDWLEDAFDLDDYSWPIRSWGFWRWQNCGDDQNSFTLPAQTQTIDEGESATLEFVWDTTIAGEFDPIPLDFVVDVSATVLGHTDANMGDNHIRNQPIGLATKDASVRLVCVHPEQVNEGDEVTITAWISNEGLFNVLRSVTCFAYYDDANDPNDSKQLISEVWCEHTGMAFELGENAERIVDFYWDTSGVGSGTYNITVEIPELEFEIDLSNNSGGDCDDRAARVVVETIIGELFRRGDHDGSGMTDITDGINFLGFLFLGSTPPICNDASDADNSGVLDLTDALIVLEHLFLGFPIHLPAPGSLECGPDPDTPQPGIPPLPPQEAISLGCEMYPSPSFPGAECP